MAIGDPIVSTIPLVGTSGTGYAEDVNTLLQEIVDRLEEAVPFSSLSGDELDMDDSPITRAEYISLEEQTDTTGVPAGGAVYSDGEWYLVDSTGVVKITDNGNINASAVGGIGGDYGGANPASLRFVDLSNMYAFYDDFSVGVWAYLRSRGVDIAAGATSAFFAQIRYGGAATITFTLPPALPASANAVVVISSSGAILKNDATTGIIGNDVYLGTSRIRETTKSYCFIINSTNSILGSATATDITGVGSGYRVTVFGTLDSYFAGLPVGCTIKSVSVRVKKIAGAVMSWALYSTVDGVGTSLASASSTGSSGFQTVVQTLSHAVVAGEAFAIHWQTGINNDEIYNVTIGYDT